MLFFFTAKEAALTFFLRILSKYEMVRDGNDNFMGNNMNVFWGVLAAVTFLYFLTLVLKTYLLYRVVLNSNTCLHEAMLNSLLRSPSSFFDSTPSGMLINKFSNDLGLLDRSLAPAFFFNF